jgi:hypothetical protein
MKLDLWLTRREQGFLLFLLALLLLGGIVYSVRGHGAVSPPETGTATANESESPKQ